MAIFFLLGNHLSFRWRRVFNGFIFIFLFSVKRAQEVVMFGNQQNKLSEHNYVRADKRGGVFDNFVNYFIRDLFFILFGIILFIYFKKVDVGVVECAFGKKD